MSVLDKQISYFPSINNANKGTVENLLSILQSNEHKTKITALRAESDAGKQKVLKELLPCYTVAGIFTRRNEKSLIIPSGLAAIDLDHAEDYDTLQLLNELKKLPYIAYTGLSCRGKRLFCIIPFLYPDKYVKHYERLIRSFNDIGLPMGDTCHKQISQPRFVSFNTDESCFYNHNAKPYHLLEAEKIYHYSRPLSHYSNIQNNTTSTVEKCLEEIESKEIDIVPAYHDWIKLGFALANEFGNAGRQYFHRVSQFHLSYNHNKVDGKYSNLLETKNPKVKIGTFFYFCRQAGISIHGHKSDPLEDFED